MECCGKEKSCLFLLTQLNNHYPDLINIKLLYKNANLNQCSFYLFDFYNVSFSIFSFSAFSFSAFYFSAFSFY